MPIVGAQTLVLDVRCVAFFVLKPERVIRDCTASKTEANL